MKSNKSAKITASGLIALITYNVLFFVLCGFADHTAVFWTSWIFMFVAFFALAITGLNMGRNGMLMRDWLFGFPIIKHSVFYIVLELILSTVFVIFEESIPWAVAFVAQFAVLAVYLVFAISCFLSKQTIEEIKTKVDDKTRYIKLLRADTEMLVNKCEDEQLKVEYRKLAEAVRYSDPMSDEALFELEKDIALTVANCDQALSAQDYQEASELLHKAMTLLEERNKKCKALK